MKKEFRSPSTKDNSPRMCDPFVPGTLAVVSLGNPKAKFWGMVLASAPAGLSLSGVDLASLEDLAVMVRDGEPCRPAVVFFPLHRVERMELDLSDGQLPSLAERFFTTTGLQASSWLLPSVIQEPAIRRARTGIRPRTAERTA